MGAIYAAILIIMIYNTIVPMMISVANLFVKDEKDPVKYRAMLIALAVIFLIGGQFKFSVLINIIYIVVDVGHRLHGRGACSVPSLEVLRQEGAPGIRLVSEHEIRRWLRPAPFWLSGVRAGVSACRRADAAVGRRTARRQRRARTTSSALSWKPIHSFCIEEATPWKAFS